MTHNSPDENNDPFSRKSIRNALSNLRNAFKLAEHPLAKLRIVETQRLDKGYSDSPQGRGFSLREVLARAIDSLRPTAALVDESHKDWRPYKVVKSKYVEGLGNEYLRDVLAIADRTRQYAEADAIDRIRTALYEWEERAHRPPLYHSFNLTEIRQVMLLPNIHQHQLVGRANLLNTLRKQLLSGQNLALTGKPGVGKTALALEVAYDKEVQNRFKDGVLWAGLGKGGDVLALLADWVTALGIPPELLPGLATVEERKEAIRRAIGTRHMLLVIDDAWDVDAAMCFQAGGMNCVHLVTTRFPKVAIHFAGEGWREVEELEKTDGLELLRQLVPAVVEQEEEEAKRIVEAVGGLPLALILVGGYLRSESHSEQPRRIRNALDQLSQTQKRLEISLPQSVPHPSLPKGAHISLAAVISLSCDEEVLPSAARNMLHALSLLPPKPNSFSEEAAAAVAGESVDNVDILTDYGLLESYGPGRYMLHQTIHDYASSNASDRTMFAGRLVEFFVNFVQANRADAKTLTVERNNILAAFDYALSNVELGYNEAVCILAYGLGYQAYNRGILDDAETYFLHGLKIAERVEPTPHVISLLKGLGDVALRRGNNVLARSHLQKALELARMIDSRWQTANLLADLGVVTTNLQDFVTAETYLKECYSLAQETEQPLALLTALVNLSDLADKRGNYLELEKYSKASLELAEETGHAGYIGVSLANLGIFERRSGRFDEGQKLMSQGLAFAEQDGDRWIISAIYHELGELHLEQLKLELALESFETELKIARKLGSPERTGDALFGLARVATSKGDLGTASQLAHESHTLFEAINSYKAGMVEEWQKKQDLEKGHGLPSSYNSM